MIIWLNGPFGGGKTTTAAALDALLPEALVFDPEKVGESITPTLAAVETVRDFQDWRPWRELVVASLVSLDRYTGRTIVAPQTVVVERYWDEITAGLAEAGIEVRAFTLDCTPEEHERRIATDTLTLATLTQIQADDGGVGWRRHRAPDYRAALSWLAGRTEVIDTTALTPDEVAREIATRTALLV
ncbi:AAA family ATPase [Promicromonospora thailandica]|uniref:Shikimate kinase n=1 Tax=Promicromonospora thailandica TaxID=765201 RepID=A0A9X2GA46_9MICO|nr:AAA family ATPase [Promicromonospora thailandica]MCP2265959.1 shikimate kinase [Promicromonospora thailandica]BFF21465.1 AAA family ATPase [Promicromonospora thailandica]